MITIIASTNRPNSYTQRIANEVNTLLSEWHVEKKILSLQDLPHDFIFSHFDGRIHPEFTAVIENYIQPASHFIFVIPEYNGSFPGVVKSFLDCISPRFFHGKKAALIGVADGHAGALRALDMFTLILHHLRMEVHWNKPKLSDILSHMDAGNHLSTQYTERIRSMLKEFLG